MAPVIIDNLHKYGIDFQTKVIAGLLTDKEFLERVSDIIDIEMFENAQHQWIVREILDYFIQYKEIPTMQVFKVRVDTIPDSRDDLKVGVIGSLRAVYLKVEETDLDFIRTQFLEFCKNQKLKKAIYDSIDHLKDGNYDQIRVAVDCALKAGMERNLGHNYKGDVEVRMSNASREVVKTGWGVMDSLLDGGMGKGELFIGVAPSGIGKCVGPNTEIEIEYYSTGIPIKNTTGGESILWIDPFEKFEINGMQLYGWQVDNVFYEIEKIKNETSNV